MLLNGKTLCHLFVLLSSLGFASTNLFLGGTIYASFLPPKILLLFLSYSHLYAHVLSKDTHTCAGKRGTSKYRCSLAPPLFHGVVVIIL